MWCTSLTEICICHFILNMGIITNQLVILNNLYAVQITLLLVLYMGTSVAGADAYSCCKNSAQPGYGPLWDCRRCGLTSVPPYPPQNATAISLEANEIMTIPKGSFQNYTNVIWLNLQNNSLTLRNGTVSFDDIPQLKYLCLARNPIVLSYINTQNIDIFTPLSNLEELDIYRVEYNETDDHHFDDYPGKYLAPLVNLNSAILPVVSFKKFGSDFLHLTKLQTLQLIGTMPGAKKIWTVMKNMTFINLPHLTSLHLIDSSLRFIESHAFQPLKILQRFEVFCSALQAIELLNAIENLPAPSLETLFFEHDRSIADVPRNKPYKSLRNLTTVTMGIPVMVPHPNPFNVDFFPIFLPSVSKLEIIRPYSNVHVSTVYRNPKNPSQTELHITISNTIEDIPYRTACIMTSRQTKVDVAKHKRSIEEPLSAFTTRNNTSKVNSAVSNKPTKDLHNSLTRTHVTKSVQQYQTATPGSFHPGCYSGLYDVNMCYRLLSLTLTLYISYSQSQVFDLVIKSGQDLGIETELINLTVNHFLYNILPGNPILHNLQELKLPRAGLHNLASRNMSQLTTYDFSGNLVEDLCHTDAISRLHSLQVFNASNNNLKCINQVSFMDAMNLTYVSLRNNDLENVSLNISHLSKLEMIDLRKNSIKFFSIDFIEQISQHSNVRIDLSGNPLACTCGPEYIAFIFWMICNPKTFINFDNYKCLDMHGKIRYVKNINIAEYKATCKSKLPVYIAVPVTCSFFVIVLMTWAYKHRWRITWYTYTLRNCFTKACMGRQNKRGYQHYMTNAETEEDNVCDIFLSYTQEDIDIKNPVLEKLQSRFSVIHPEAFEWGKSVFLESVNGIQNSQKTVFLVTSNFAQCPICNFQLHMALIKGQENIILVQMESEFELASSGIQPFLHSLLQSSETYEYHNNDFFWNRFFMALETENMNGLETVT